jgi:hypothetical protein
MAIHEVQQRKMKLFDTAAGAPCFFLLVHAGESLKGVT